MSAERAERARRLGGYFELQLRLAGRVAELTGRPLGAVALAYTNFHRRFGLRTARGDGAPEWAPYAAALDAAPTLAEQVALTQRTFVTMPEEIEPPPPRRAFGCFACDAPEADGTVQMHFHNLDADEAGGPLAAAKADRRRAELAALTAHVRATWPQATHVRGRSWLYNLAAYRRLFPPDYADNCAPVDAGVNLHGNSVWGQAIDSAFAVRPDVRDHVVARLPQLDPAAAWRVFPLQPLTTRAPLETFERFYGV